MKISSIFVDFLENTNFTYRTRAIITRGLYTFYPLFEGQKRFFKEVFSENSAFMIARVRTVLKDVNTWY